MVKECSIHDIHKTCKLNMDRTAGKKTLFVLLIFSASRSRKRKEEKKKLQNGKSKEEIEKRLAFRMFKFSIHVCANAGDKGNIQRTMPNSTN